MRTVPKADRALTEAAHFKDPKSWVAKDGREILFGDDWNSRRFELLKRCGGRCEYMIQQFPHPVRCNREAADPHHLTLRSILRDDRLEHLQALCRHHHLIEDARQRKEKRERRRA
jgi:hypothetical protein